MRFPNSSVAARFVLSLCVPGPRQPPAGQRAPGDHADSLGGTKAHHLPLFLAVEEIVKVLHRDEPRPAVAVGQVKRLAELPGIHRRCAQVPGLAGFDDVVKGLERLLDRRLVVPAVDLVEVDMVGAKPRRLASISVMIAFRERPRAFASVRDEKKTLVAITTSSRLAKSRRARPVISSLVPSE